MSIFVRRPQYIKNAYSCAESLSHGERFLKTTASLSNLIPPCFYYPANYGRFSVCFLSPGVSYPPVSTVVSIARKPTYVRRIHLFLFYSYVKSHLDNDIWIPIYKTIQAICNTPRQTQCVPNSIFPHFIMVIMMCCGGPSCGLWFVVVCWCANRGCAKKNKKTHHVGILPLSI